MKNATLIAQKHAVGVICVNDEQEDEFTSIRIIETEIGQPLQAIAPLKDKAGRYYQRALCLIRLHTQPLGTVALQLDEHGLSADAYAWHIWDTLHVPILRHLQADGLPAVTRLDAAGLSYTLPARCVEKRASFLRDAPFVSVIVATRDHPDYLARCLRSLMALHYPDYEVIIVDNAPSTTETAELVQRTYGHEERIRYIRENRPGLSLARNCGINAARGAILAFTDDDVVVDTYWLAELVQPFYCNKNIACVTGLVMPLELEVETQAWFEEFGGLGKGFTRRIFDRAGRNVDIPLYPFAAGQFGAGASMAFTSAFLRKIGGFDPALGTGTRTGGGEDLSAFFQVISSGSRLVYEPASILYHLHRRDYFQLRKQIYYYGAGLMAYLTKIIVDNPLLLFSILAKVPYGLFFILSTRSTKNSKRSRDYPRDLITLERRGMFSGPFAFLRGRWETRKFSGRRGQCV